MAITDLSNRISGGPTKIEGGIGDAMPILKADFGVEVEKIVGQADPDPHQVAVREGAAEAIRDVGLDPTDVLSTELPKNQKITFDGELSAADRERWAKENGLAGGGSTLPPPAYLICTTGAQQILENAGLPIVGDVPASVEYSRNYAEKLVAEGSAQKITNPTDLQAGDFATVSDGHALTVIQLDNGQTALLGFDGYDNGSVKVELVHPDYYTWGNGTLAVDVYRIKE